MSEKSSTPRIPTLDGWRAIAILAVIACHSTGFWWNSPPYTLSLLREIMVRGSYGVDIFFAISGFLICTRLLDDEIRAGRIDLLRFYVRRAFRILPPYLVYLTVLAILAVSGTLAVSGASLLKTVFFLQNYLIRADDANWYLGHFWSLAVEEHYYLIFPTLLLALGTDTGRRFRVVLLGAFAVAVWRVVSFHYQIPGLFRELSFYTRTDVRLDALFFGAAFALGVRIPRLNALFKRGKWLNAFGLLGAALFLSAVATELPLKMLWIALSIPAMLLWTIRNPQTIVGVFLEHPAMQWIGRLSYSLYLWNNFFLVPWSAPKAAPLAALQSFPLNLPALLAVACASYYFIEKPTIALGRQLSDRLATLP